MKSHESPKGGEVLRVEEPMAGEQEKDSPRGMSSAVDYKIALFAVYLAVLQSQASRVSDYLGLEWSLTKAEYGQSFGSFFPFYVSQHQDDTCVLLHVVATGYRSLARHVCEGPSRRPVHGLVGVGGPVVEGTNAFFEPWLCGDGHHARNFLDEHAAHEGAMDACCGSASGVLRSRLGGTLLLRA